MAEMASRAEADAADLKEGLARERFELPSAAELAEEGRQPPDVAALKSRAKEIAEVLAELPKGRSAFVRRVDAVGGRIKPKRVATDDRAALTELLADARALLNAAATQDAAALAALEAKHPAGAGVAASAAGETSIVDAVFAARARRRR